MFCLLLTILFKAVLSLGLSACGASGGTTLGGAAQADAPSTGSEENVVLDPAFQNEVHVTSDEPYVMSGDQTYWVEDKVLHNGYMMPL